MRRQHGSVCNEVYSIPQDEVSKHCFSQTICCANAFSQIYSFRVHPEIVETKRIRDKKKDALNQYNKKLNHLLVDEMYSMRLYDIDDLRLERQSGSIGRNDLQCTQFLQYILGTKDAIEKIVEAPDAMSQSKIDDLVKTYPDLIEHLLGPEKSNDDRSEKKAKTTDNDRERENMIAQITDLLGRQSVENMKVSPDCRIAFHVMKEVVGAFDRLLENFEVSQLIAEKLVLESLESDKSYETTKARIKRELPGDARVFLSTIGSSHQLIEKLNSVSVKALNSLDIKVPPAEKPTFVVFDEAGCIPAYELLGLSQISENIVGILCIGDEHQLPPFGNDMALSFRSGNRKNGQLVAKQSVAGRAIKSILDVSQMHVDDDNKVKLTHQYRVPRDIADILNLHIYKGDYITAESSRVKFSGFMFVDVKSKFENHKYINHNECNACLALLRGLRRQGQDDVLILTPVSVCV
jgi:DNA-binding protein Fis